MSKAPAFQFYPDKAIAGTMHLSDQSFRAYWLTLWWMWLHSGDQCSMPDTDQAWAIATGIRDPKEREQVRTEIMAESFPLLKKKRKRIYSSGLQKERAKQVSRREQAQNAAKTRWKSDAGAMREHSASIAKDIPPQCTPSPSASPSPSSSAKKKEKGPAANPPTAEEVKAYADSIGYTTLDPEAFIAYYQAQGWKLSNGRVMADWKACVVTWKKRDAKQAGVTAKETDQGVLDYAKQYNRLVAEQPEDDSFERLYKKVRDNYGPDGVKRMKAAAKQLKESGGK